MPGMQAPILPYYIIPSTKFVYGTTVNDDAYNSALLKYPIMKETTGDENNENRVSMEKGFPYYPYPLVYLPQKVL